MQSQIELQYQNVKDRPKARIVRFIGDLDATNVEKIVDDIIELYNEGICNIIADFKRLRYVNSTGLGVLLHFSKTAKDKKGCFKIVNVNENVYEIIEIIGATALLDLCDTVEDAIDALPKDS